MATLASLVLWHHGILFVDVLLIALKMGWSLLSTPVGRRASHDTLVGLTLLVQWTWNTQISERTLKKMKSLVSFVHLLHFFSLSTTFMSGMLSSKLFSLTYGWQTLPSSAAEVTECGRENGSNTELCTFYSVLRGIWLWHEKATAMLFLCKWSKTLLAMIRMSTLHHSIKCRCLNGWPNICITIITYCLLTQWCSTCWSAAEGQAGRLLRSAGWSDSGLQWEGSQRAEAQSRHQTVGQTGEHEWA